MVLLYVTPINIPVTTRHKETIAEAIINFVIASLIRRECRDEI
jgi:hypothetical protein